MRGLYIFWVFLLRKCTSCTGFVQEVNGPVCCTIVRAKISLGYLEKGVWSLFFGLCNLAFSGAFLLFQLAICSRNQLERIS